MPNGGCVPDSRRGISSCRSHCTSASRPPHSVAKLPESRHIELAGKLEVTELFCLGFYLPDGGRWDRSEVQGWASDLVAAAPPGGRRRASRRSNSVRTLRGWLEPARGEFCASCASMWRLGVLCAFGVPLCGGTAFDVRAGLFAGSG
jgi:hypothetical protein